jgi:FdhE protein
MQGPVPRVEDELARYVARFPELEEVAGLYADIFRLQEELKGRVGPREPAGRAQALEKLSKDIPLLENDVALIQPGLFRDAAVSLSEILRKWNGDDFPAERILAAPQLSAECLPKFFEDLREDYGSALAKLSDETGANHETLAFFVRTLLTPFYESEAQRYSELLRETHRHSGACPACGSPPGMARLRQEDGRRVLQCSLCRAEWDFPRIGCPFCGNTDQSTLRYFYLDGDPGHRVNVCERCKKYIKTSDGKTLGRPVILQVEDVATLPLDHLAAEEGYTAGLEDHLCRR